MNSFSIYIDNSIIASVSLELTPTPILFLKEIQEELQNKLDKEVKDYSTYLLYVENDANIAVQDGDVFKANKNVIGKEVKVKRNGVYIDYDYYDNNQSFVFLFGYPININNPNGIYLLKLSQIQIQYKDQQLCPFYSDIQFARLFCLWFAYQYCNVNYNRNDIMVALAMFMYKYHVIQPYAICRDVANNIFEYMGDVGSIRQLCLSQYKQRGIGDLVNFLKFLVEQSTKENAKYYQQNRGYMIPSECIGLMSQAQFNMYETLFQMKQYMTKDQYAQFSIYIQTADIDISNSIIIGSEIDIDQMIDTSVDTAVNQNESV